MLWRSDMKPAAVGANDDAAAPVDAAAEEARIKNLTGGKPVVIQRDQGPRLKLPGL